MASSKLHVSGYRPLVTRLIGQGDESAEKAQPVMPRLSAEEGWGIDQVEPPPPGGYSNYTDYPTEEVILEDLWRDGAPDRPQPHRLPPPPPQPDANFSFAFAVEFSPAKNLTLPSPTRLVHADAPYDFAGFLVLCHYEVSVPELQLICGGDMVAARFAPGPIQRLTSRRRAGRSRRHSAGISPQPVDGSFPTSRTTPTLSAWIPAGLIAWPSGRARSQCYRLSRTTSWR